ncbi:hypothetical protein V6259_18090 [Marinomonas sp. TI.3.20]|uniref:hypothetical protein n=1 Tax=Marinomonas sp. TI.3.20 TaxID=3121296 RepID=UPI00311E7FDA
MNKYLLSSLVLGLSISYQAHADFIYVPHGHTQELPMKNYDTPVSATNYDTGSNLVITGMRDPISEVGNRTYLAEALTPLINSYEMSVGDLLLAIIPQKLTLKVDSAVDQNKLISFKSTNKQPWLKTLSNFNRANHLWSIIDWSKATISIGSNLKEKFPEPKKDKIIIGDDGQEYVIRKKEDDLNARSDAGMLIKDGQVKRFKAIDSK